MGTCNGPSLETPRARAQAGLWGLLRVLSREEITGEDCLCISDAHHRNMEAKQEGEEAAGTPGRVSGARWDALAQSYVISGDHWTSRDCSPG